MADCGNVNNNNGYFSVSYYNSNLGYDKNTLFVAENSNDYTNIYQYDPLEWIRKLTYLKLIPRLAGVQISLLQNLTKFSKQ